MLPVIQLEEMEKKVPKQKISVFFDKLPKGCSKTDHTSSSGIVTTTFTISKESLTACVTKPGVNLKNYCRRMGGQGIYPGCAAGILDQQRRIKAQR